MTDRATPSVAARVTLFEDRAEVQRKARCQVPAGVSWVTLSGVTVGLDDPSLVASIAGDGARVIAARVLRRRREEPAASPSELAALERERATQVTAFARAEHRYVRTEALTRRAGESLSAWVDAVKEVPRGDDDPQGAVARWRSAWGDLRAHLESALDANTRAFTERNGAELAMTLADQRYEQGRALHARYEALVEVQVESPSALEVEIDLSYRAPCALWRPEHLCRLVARDGGGHEMLVRTWAAAWQCTGEDWSDVAIRFSTARPAQQAAAPLIAEDALVLRRKTDVERRTVSVEARDQSISVAGLQRGVRAVEEMPGVEDGGEALYFDAPRPATIPSDGAPVRVELGEVRLACEVDRVAYPERTMAVHVRATATLTAPWPLLAGPVAVARGSEVVGRGRSSYVGRGDAFEMGFGVDDGLRVRRQVDEKREYTTVIGTQKITRTVRLYLSNVSGQVKRLTVTERVPVSEVKDVEVLIVQTGGAKHDAKDGFMRWDIELSPRGTQELSLVYRIEAAAKVNLNL